ncbi:hypothetical protein CS8_009890 [Cupriavidus sp. 8B]
MRRVGAATAPVKYWPVGPGKRMRDGCVSEPCLKVGERALFGRPAFSYQADASATKAQWS